MDFGIYLVFCVVVLLLDILGISFKRGLFCVFGMLFALVVAVSAVQDSTANSGQGFVAGVSANSAGTFFFRYTPLVPSIYIIVFFFLISAILIITERKHFA